MNSSKKRGKKWQLQVLTKRTGIIFLGRYVDYWKSGDYFHKKVYFARCKKDSDNDCFITISRDGLRTGNLRYLSHNLEVIEQFKTLEELNKNFQRCKNYNEY